MDKRRFTTALAGAAALAAIGTRTGAARAQAFPARPVRVVVPYAAGGTSDILARTLAGRVGDALGQPVHVENKPGANGILGSDLVAKAPPDGYTLLLTDVGGLASGPALVPNLPLNPLRDLAPVTMIAYSPHLVVVAPGLAVRNLAELLALSRARAGGLNVATSGAGSAPHLAAALFAHRNGLAWTFIPYKGGAQALNDVAGGQADLMFNGMLATLPLVKAGRLRAIAVSGAQRWPTLPELSTVQEQGFPGFVTGSWQGLMAPAGTPAEIVSRLAAEFGRALSHPEVAERLTAQGAEPRPSRPEVFGEFMRTETTKWAQLVKETGIKAE